MFALAPKATNGLVGRLHPICALSARPRHSRLRESLVPVGHYVCAALATLLAAHKRGTVAQEGDTRPR